MFPEFNDVMAANMVMMLRADVDGAIWLIDDEEEGRFYENVAHDKGRVIPAFGSAGRVLDIVNGRGLEGVFAVARGKPTNAEPAMLFRPDIGDVASMLLTARSADRVLGEVGGAAWLTAAGREIGGILSRAVLIARRLEHLLGTGLVSDDRVAALVDWHVADVNWALNEADLEAVPAEAIDTAKRIASTEQVAADLLGCDGMTAIRVLAAATNEFRPRGIRAYRAVSSAELLSLLRASYELEEIEKDGLYWRLKEWEWRHSKYNVFKPWRKREPFNVLLDHRYLESDVHKLCAIGLQFALLQMDLDHFKNVNERLGHIEGDDAIRLAERTLLGSLKGKGEAYRRGGDELAAVLIGVSSSDVDDWAESIRTQVEEHFGEWAKKRNLLLSPTASIGVSHVPGRCDPVDLIARVEAAQVAAKHKGKNCVVTDNL